MFTMPISDAPASTVPVAVNSSPAESESQPRSPHKSPPHEPSGDNVRHMLFGTPDAVRKTVHNLHSRGYADPNDWSPAISTGRCNEVMRLLIKRVSTD